MTAPDGTNTGSNTTQATNSPRASRQPDTSQTVTNVPATAADQATSSDRLLRVTDPFTSGFVYGEDAEGNLLQIGREYTPVAAGDVAALKTAAEQSGVNIEEKTGE